jgi:hypothetical protein
MSAPVQLLRRTTCPHCWETFAPEDVLWISAHSDLLGDPRLGPEQAQRFLPTRFNADGDALDPKGFVCNSLACPRCHLHVPRILLEIEPLFISILGTPACGKSYYLTTLTWQLRQLLTRHFGLVFGDADPVSNRSLNEYEEWLFLNPRADELIPLADLIRKTELQGELYDTVMFGNQNVSYPRPYLFTLQPHDTHPRRDACQRHSRVLCLYDNAGEHFQPGQDTTASPVTHHLASSRLLLFLFDPTQDQRFRSLCAGEKIDPAHLAAGRTSRQELVLQEAASRIRRYTGLSQKQKHNRPLIVVVTKLDVWAHLLKDKNLEEPWVRSDWLFGVDLDRVEWRSREVRELLQRVCPEFVTAAESFAQSVTYVPVSALGNSPVAHPQTKGLAVRPRNINPIGVTVPFLYGLSRVLPNLVSGYKRKQPATGVPAARTGEKLQRPAGH